MRQYIANYIANHFLPSYHLKQLYFVTVSFYTIHKLGNKT